MAEYIHQLEGWPKFHWSDEKLAVRLAAVSRHQGRLIGRMESLGFQLRAEAVLESLTEEVTKTSEIEGETLDKQQVRSSIARRLGMDIGGLRPIDRNVEGVVEMMLDATQNFEAPLTKDRLFNWHAALFPTGRTGMAKIIVGDWRDDRQGPMQVISGPIGRERVHYEAPSANRIDREMRAFLNWFNEPVAIDPVFKAAIAHLWFVTIHPFEDGNGRIARAIAEMALARSEKSPRRFYSMSAQIRVERKGYYDILEATQRGDLDVTSWLVWFLNCLDRAFDGPDAILAAVLRKAHFWQSQAGHAFNDRQRKVLNRLLEGFDGNLTSSKWAAVAKTSQDTAARDIDDLVRGKILFKKAGGGRSTSYLLVVTAADALREVAAYTRTHAGTTVWGGAKMPSEEERAERKRVVGELAEQVDALAEESLREQITYRSFEMLLEALQGNGFYPDGQLVAAVAFAIGRDQQASPLLASTRL